MPRRKVRNICPGPVRKCRDCAFFSSVCPFRERTSAGDGCSVKERAKEKPFFVNRPSRRALPARQGASYARKPRSRSLSQRARRSSAVARWRRYVPKARPNSERMLIRVERGKGGRYRNAMLSPDLLTLLRTWWLEGRRQGAMFPGGWLFP